MTRDDGMIPQVQLEVQKNVQFDVDIENDTFFEARNTIRRDPSKFLVYEMSPIFYSTLVAGPS